MVGGGTLGAGICIDWVGPLGPSVSAAYRTVGVIVREAGNEQN
jgi:hypothetical protein